MLADAPTFDPETGELEDGCSTCRGLLDQVAGLERDVRAWRARYAELARDRERDAREHPSWDAINSLFAHWRSTCRHPRSRFTADRFWEAEPIFRRYGDEMCRRAIDGAAFDPFVTARKNGTRKRHDDWELIFRNAGKFEEFCNRAPRTDPGVAS